MQPIAFLTTVRGLSNKPPITFRAHVIVVDQGFGVGGRGAWSRGALLGAVYTSNHCYVVDVCRHSSTHVDARKRMLTFVDVRRRTSVYVDVRRRTSMVVDVRGRMSAYASSAFVDIRQRASVYLGVRRRTPTSVDRRRRT